MLRVLSRQQYCDNVLLFVLVPECIAGAMCFVRIFNRKRCGIVNNLKIVVADERQVGVKTACSMKKIRFGGRKVNYNARLKRNQCSSTSLTNEYEGRVSVYTGILTTLLLLRKRKALKIQNFCVNLLVGHHSIVQ